MNTDILADLRLTLQLENPDYEDCYVDGYACGLANLPEDLNPYAQDSMESEYWTEGWWSAFYQEKPLFTLEGVNLEAQPKPQVTDYIVTFLEISGVLAVSSLLGYQILELVA